MEATKYFNPIEFFDKNQAIEEYFLKLTDFNNKADIHSALSGCDLTTGASVYVDYCGVDEKKSFGEYAYGRYSEKKASDLAIEKKDEVEEETELADRIKAAVSVSHIKVDPYPDPGDPFFAAKMGTIQSQIEANDFLDGLVSIPYTLHVKTTDGCDYLINELSRERVYHNSTFDKFNKSIGDNTAFWTFLDATGERQTVFTIKDKYVTKLEIPLMVNHKWASTEKIFFSKEVSISMTAK